MGHQPRQISQPSCPITCTFAGPLAHPFWQDNLKQQYFLHRMGLLLLAPSEICAIIPYRDFSGVAREHWYRRCYRAMAMVPSFAIGGGWVGRVEFLACSLVFSSAVSAQTLMPASGPG